jgi:hypothetical protein
MLTDQDKKRDTELKEVELISVRLEFNENMKGKKKMLKLFNPLTDGSFLNSIHKEDSIELTLKVNLTLWNSYGHAIKALEYAEKNNIHYELKVDNKNLKILNRIINKIKRKNSKLKTLFDGACIEKL